MIKFYDLKIIWREKLMVCKNCSKVGKLYQSNKCRKCLLIEFESIKID